MEFIENNYIWIIVVGIVILMTIIGYFADKSEKKEKVPKVKKEKKQKKNNDMKEEVPEVEETPDMDNSFATEWDENKKPVEEENEVINVEGAATTDWNTLPEDGGQSTVESSEETTEENPMDWDTEIANDVETEEEPIFTGNSDTTEINNQVDVPVEEKIEVPTEEVETESVSEEVPVEETTEEIPTESVEEIKEEPIDELNELEITLPSIQTLNDEIKDVEDDEDVWKF